MEYEHVTIAYMEHMGTGSINPPSEIPNAKYVNHLLHGMYVILLLIRKSCLRGTAQAIAMPFMTDVCPSGLHSGPVDRWCLHGFSHDL